MSAQGGTPLSFRIILTLRNTYALTSSLVSCRFFEVTSIEAVINPMYLTISKGN